MASGGLAERVADNRKISYFIDSMKIKQTLLLFAILVGITGLVSAPVAFATNCGTTPLKSGQSCCGGVVTSILSCPDQKGGTNNAEDSGIWGVLLVAINILTAGVGVAAVGGIVYGSIIYTSATGSPENAKKAKMIIFNTAIGIVVYAAMYAFLNFLVPGGLFK